MYPGYFHWWKNRHHHGGGEAWAGCGPHGCGPEAEHEPPWRGRWHGEREASGEGGGFGVRRPLRFLAYKLDLDEQQVGELARILNELKTERAQAEVDQRRTVGAFADAIGAETFDEAKAGEGATLRVQSAERLKEAVTRALKSIHALLKPEQRQQLAYLIRTGVVSI
jgi:Spy/CpxP family protein refolding chaperone